MSLSSNEKTKNPAKRWYEWKGGLGVWQYWDGEKNVQVDEPMYIVPLDELSTVKGWHDASQSGIYANECKFLNDEELVVKSFKGGEIARGLYKNIKGNLEGGKYCKSVYAALLDSKGNVVEMVNFGFMGSSLGSWIDARVNIKEGKVIVLSKNPEKQKKGATTYYVPKVSIKDKRDAIIAECESLDKELQDYLSQYKTEKRQEEGVNVELTTAPKVELSQVAEAGDDGLPFTSEYIMYGW